MASTDCNQGWLEPCLGKDGGKKPDHGQAGLGQGAEKKAEDQVGDKQRPDGDDAGQDIALQAAQCTGKDWFHALLP